MKALSNDMMDQIRTKARQNLYFFAKGVLGFDFIDQSIHFNLSRVLELYDGYYDLEHPWDDYVLALTDVFRRMGKELDSVLLEKIRTKGMKKLKFTLPRGWLKTTMCSCSYPLWRSVRDCNVRVLLTQNTYTNACSKLKRIKGAFEENPLFRALWPELLPDGSCTWKGDSLCIKRTKSFDESTFEAAGTRTQVTSRHYDLIIEDDTVAPELEDSSSEVSAPSEEDIEKAIGWHRLAGPLLVNPGSSQILVVGTRWAELDLLSWIDENEPFFVTYQRASREDEDGNPDENGPAQYPGRFDDEVLDQIKLSLGPYMYAALYMNSPMASADMAFKIEWIKYYDEAPRNLFCWTTVDLAGDPKELKGKKPDYNVVMTCGKDIESGIVYVLDYFRGRCSPGVVIDEILEHVRKWKPVKVGIESVQYQSSLIYWIKERKKQEGLRFLVEGITHGRRSKSSRILGLQPVVHSGALRFRTYHNGLINELIAFPLGANDDLIDALSMQLKMWSVTRSVKEIREEIDDNDPLSFNNALRELTGRHDPRTLVYGQR